MNGSDTMFIAWAIVCMRTESGRGSPFIGFHIAPSVTLSPVGMCVVNPGSQAPLSF